MSEDKTIEILKNAILLEKRGQAFYGKVAEQASGNAVKEFFEMMAGEATVFNGNDRNILVDELASRLLGLSCDTSHDRHFMTLFDQCRVQMRQVV